jgi:hypothetical protein
MALLKKLGFLILSSQALLLGSDANCCSLFSHEEEPNLGPQPVGTIPDATLFAGSNECGPTSLDFDVTPYFDGMGHPLTYCLSSVSYEGDISDLTVTLNPFTGALHIPAGWFGCFVAINLHLIAKNAHGSAEQHMKVNLDPCGG